MNYLFRHIAIFSVITFPSLVAAADIGMGLSLRDDELEIYMPIDWDNKYRLEPYVLDEQREVNSENDDGFINESETTYREYGFGLFRLFDISDSVSYYLGLRLGKVKYKSSYSYGYDPLITEESTSEDGFDIGPAIGFEFSPLKHFSIGADGGYYYRKMESDSSGDYEETTSSTKSRIIIRFFF